MGILLVSSYCKFKILIRTIIKFLSYQFFLASVIVSNESLNCSLFIDSTTMFPKTISSGGIFLPPVQIEK